MNEPAHSNAWRHFADEAEVLKWLTVTADDFRSSKLPGGDGRWEKDIGFLWFSSGSSGFLRFSKVF